MNHIVLTSPPKKGGAAKKEEGKNPPQLGRRKEEEQRNRRRKQLPLRPYVAASTLAEMSGSGSTRSPITESVLLTFVEVFNQSTPNLLWMEVI